MPEESLREALIAGAPAFGGWCVIPSTISAEIVGQVGFDWVGIDWQHGFMNPETAAAMIQVIGQTGAAPFIRVAFNDPMTIMKALDLGGFGVIVPLVNNRNEAEAAVSVCRYPPIGQRSFGPIRSAAVIGTEPNRCNTQIFCFVMIETAAGLANAEEICATPGLDGIYIGPADLRLSLGASIAETNDAIETILQTCKRRNVLAGIHADSGDDAHALAERGFNLIGIASDIDFLSWAALDALKSAKGSRGIARTTLNGIVRSVVNAGL